MAIIRIKPCIRNFFDEVWKCVPPFFLLGHCFKPRAKSRRRLISWPLINSPYHHNIQSHWIDAADFSSTPFSLIPRFSIFNLILLIQITSSRSQMSWLPFIHTGSFPWLPNFILVNLQVTTVLSDNCASSERLNWAVSLSISAEAVIL